MSATPRQARLVDWLRHPELQLPVHEAIKPRQAFWSAAEIVERTGDLFPNRRACLRDLEALRKSRVVIRLGDRWRYRRTGEDEL